MLENWQPWCSNNYILDLLLLLLSEASRCQFSLAFPLTAMTQSMSSAPVPLLYGLWKKCTDLVPMPKETQLLLYSGFTGLQKGRREEMREWDQSCSRYQPIELVYHVKVGSCIRKGRMVWTCNPSYPGLPGMPPLWVQQLCTVLHMINQRYGLIPTATRTHWTWGCLAPLAMWKDQLSSWM